MEKIHASKLLAGLVPAGKLTSDPEVALVTMYLFPPLISMTAAPLSISSRPLSMIPRSVLSIRALLPV